MHGSAEWCVWFDGNHSSSHVYASLTPPHTTHCTHALCLPSQRSVSALSWEVLTVNSFNDNNIRGILFIHILCVEHKLYNTDRQWYKWARIKNWHKIMYMTLGTYKETYSKMVTRNPWWGLTRYTHTHKNTTKNRTPWTQVYGIKNTSKTNLRLRDTFILITI